MLVPGQANRSSGNEILDLDEELLPVFIAGSTPASGKPEGQRRSRAERGLPSKKILLELAKAYLEIQRRRWPALKGSAELPRPTKANLARMAKDFRARFLDQDMIGPVSEINAIRDLAAVYLRYSSEKSNARSLVQQLKLALRKANENGHFVPWSCVFADAAVSGMTAFRRGYIMAKAAIKDNSRKVKVLYIDEIGRASRNAIEALMLGQLIDSLNKRLIGVSDGFDSTSPMAKLMLSMFAALQEWFIDQLRSKVNRGQDDAFDVGGNLGNPAIGYKAIPMVDAHGRVVVGKDGQPTNTLAIDEKQAEYVLATFTLYAEKGWSKIKIARHFNALRVGDSQTWDARRIHQLLTRHKYVGILTYRMTRRIVDPTTGKTTIINRPRSEWKVRRARELQMIPWRLWKKAQQRLKATSEAFKTRRSRSANATTRADVYPKTLFKLICGSCNTPLILGHSCEHQSVCCHNSASGKSGCKYKGYKSVAIIERCILGHLEDHIFTNEGIQELIKKANKYLQQMSRQPKSDTTVLQLEIKSIESRLHRLLALTEHGKIDIDLARRRIRSGERLLKKSRAELEELARKNSPPPPLLTDQDAGWIRDNFRDILKLDVQRAAPLLRELMGPITVHQQSVSGKKRPDWTAHFSFDMVHAVVQLAAKDCPTKGTWEYLKTTGWTMTVQGKIALVPKLPRYEVLAQEVAELYARCKSLSVVAARLKINNGLVRFALDFALTGKRPVWKASSKRKHSTKSRGRRHQKYIEAGEKVARLREQKHWSFLRIGRALGISRSTAIRAFDHARPEHAAQAIETSKRIDRGQWSHLGPKNTK